MKPIYKPKGKAAEYADWALNLYTGCTNGCEYCYAPAVLRKSRETFAEECSLRKGVMNAAMKQLENGSFEGETIHLCFTCDPYPFGIDATPTREIIRAIHEAGAHVQILTKRPLAAELDFDLLGADDKFGVTITGAPRDIEPLADRTIRRIEALRTAKRHGIGTWVSCEPVYDPETIYRLIEECDFIDLYKIGKLNYRPSDIDWGEFGRRCEELLREHDRCYIIKESLREIMERA